MLKWEKISSFKLSLSIDFKTVVQSFACSILEIKIYFVLN